MRLIFALTAVVLSMGMASTHPSQAAPSSSEIQALTVAFLYNFMKLSEWPSESIVNEITLCAIKADDNAIDLDSLADKDIQNYKLKIKHLVPGDTLGGCQLLFIPENEKPIRVREWLKNMENQPVLTVSNITGFIDLGGMIELVSDGNHLQFEVNLAPVEHVGIKLSSKMLQIAKEVKGQ